MRLRLAGAVDVEIIVHRPVLSRALVEIAHARWRLLRPAGRPPSHVVDRFRGVARYTFAKTTSFQVRSKRLPEREVKWRCLVILDPSPRARLSRTDMTRKYHPKQQAERFDGRPCIEASPCGFSRYEYTPSTRLFVGFIAQDSNQPIINPSIVYMISNS